MSHSDYVYKTYDTIAIHFHETRYAIWSCVKEFLDNIPKNSVIIDYGCGNGKYLKYRSDIFMIGIDVCQYLLELIPKNSSSYDTMRYDITKDLPLRPSFFDYGISIAVIHHLPNTEQRIKAVQNALNLIRQEGLFLITVWAAEQPIKPKWEHLGNNDYLIPWLDKYTKQTSMRYYHLFSKDEITTLAKSLGNNIATILSVKYECNNWVLVLQKNY